MEFPDRTKELNSSGYYDTHYLKSKESAEDTMEIGPIKGLVLIGGGDILLELCRWARGEFLDVLVITSPRHAEEKMPSGLDLRLSLSEIEISFIETDDIDSHAVSNFLSETDDWLFLSIGAAWIFKDSTIKKLFRNELLNVHGSRLPTNRGGGGFSWQIMMGNRFGFSLIHRVNGGIDTGPIKAYEEYLFPHSCRKPVDFEIVYKMKSLEFIKMFISKVRADVCSYPEIEQLEYLSTYWPRLNTDINGWINWNWAGTEIERFILAFDDPYVGALTTYNGEPVNLKSVHLSSQDALFHPFQSGIVYRVSKSWICVAVPGGAIIVESVVNQNGVSLLNTIKPGDRFMTPSTYLDESFSRVAYTPDGLRTYRS